MDPTFTVRVRRRTLWQVGAVIAVLLVAFPAGVLAGHRFTDVPDSNIFHEDISAIADAGVTLGCTADGTQYCPDDPVTRGEMAAFMNRLGSLDGSTPPSVDADKVDGKDASELGSRAAFAASNDLPDANGTALSISISAPAAGILLMNAGVEGVNLIDDDVYACRIFLNGSVVVGSHMIAQVDGLEGVNEDEDCSTLGAQAVAAGTHSIALDIASVDGATALRAATLWALWVPFDGTGATPVP